MPYTAGTNTANYNNCASWNGITGNVTTVGSNGGPSAYGTYDMAGNVWEWNEDKVGSTNRVLRGGNYGYDNSYLASSYRNYAVASTRNNYIGFRIASLSASTNLVAVSDINNAPDSTGFGSVSYEYYISRYEVTNSEYVLFLNSVATTDNNNLYINNIMFLDIKKKRTYPKLREYLFSLNNYTFRIYSIADGYRIVCMNKKLTPDCDELIPIINNTNAKLLRVGNTEHFFTIRLTPKPKRAGCNNMPNLYPRTSNAEQQLFVDWLNEYDNKSQNYSVCQYIETLGDTDNIDHEILSFIEYHDQITKCFTELPLEPSRSIFNKNEG